jgi:predicted secreted Zn-dependent protease
MRTAFLWTFIWIAASAAPAAAEPLVRMNTSYYYIDGASALLLTEQINQKGPTGVDGSRYPARTRWEAQWRFRHNMHDGVCKMEDVAVAMGITTLRPRWRSESKGAKSLQVRWKQLMAAVDRNQQFHTAQAKRAGEEIEKALWNLAPAKTCEDYSSVADAAASRILKKYQAISEDHDRRTEYGRKDGASLL